MSEERATRGEGFLGEARDLDPVKNAIVQSGRFDRIVGERFLARIDIHLAQRARVIETEHSVNCA
jgi:hypothetical protein